MSQAKPRADFPLFLHRSGQWAKKVRGHTLYFGVDAGDALDRWLAEKDALLSGRAPRPVGLTVRDLVNRFLTTKKLLVDAGELSPRTFRDYHTTLVRANRLIGATRRVEDLAGPDFEKLRARLARSRGPVALAGEVQRVRSMLKYAYDEGLVDRPVRCGSTFKKPSKKVLRAARHAAGPKLFTAAECRAIVDAAEQPVKAMVLLGLNCGYGQADLAALPAAALDLPGGWANYPRPKTAMPRRAKLWPETVAAVREALLGRPRPKAPADAGLAFVTKYGHRWARSRPRPGKTAVPIDAVTLEFDKLRRRLGLVRRGLGFYALRHTFRTAVDDLADQRAIDYVMGHVPAHISAAYVERIADERLKAVSDHVRKWLWPKRR